MAVIFDFQTGRVLSDALPTGLSSVPKPFTPPRHCDAVVIRRKRGTVPEECRKSMLAKVHIAKAQLGMTEEEYRGMISGNFGVDSAGSLNVSQLDELLRLMVAVGFTATKGSAARGANRKRSVPAMLDQPGLNAGADALLGKIEALLAEKGRVEGTHVPWNYAIGILKKQSGGVTRCFEHATPEQLRGVIAALTRDAKRKGRRYA